MLQVGVMNRYMIDVQELVARTINFLFKEG